MDRFDAMRAFATVVELGSFARAAERMGLSASSLSRLVGDLEHHLGARLLHRTTRRLSLTDTGQTYYERCAQVLADVEEAEALASETRTAPRGTLRLTCPMNLVAGRIGPAIARCAARWPQLRFDVTVADRIVDLVDEGFDLAIRIGAPGSDRLVARRLGETRLVAAASPAWVAAHGLPRIPQDLATRPAVTYAYATPLRTWQLIDRAGQVSEVRVQGALHANSGELLVAAAIDGAGAVFEPEFVLAPALADGRLVRLLPGHAGRPLDIWAVYPSRRHLSAKVRMFIDEIAADFSG